jgi:hypothetical protein
VQQAGHDPRAAVAVLDALRDPAAMLAWRRHTGAPAPDAVRAQIEVLRGELEAQAAFFTDRRAAIEAAHERCLAYRPA